jgi:hypothetical protein
MKKSEIATYVLIDTAHFTKKIVKTTTKFSLKSLGLVALLSFGILGSDYALHYKDYKLHYEPGVLAYISPDNLTIPFLAVSTHNNDFLTQRALFQDKNYAIFREEFSALNDAQDSIKIQGQIEALKKLYKANENANSLSIDSFIVSAVNYFSKNVQYDNNSEINAIKEQLRTRMYKSYMVDAKISKEAYQEIENFCHTGLIGRLSCKTQSTEKFFTLMTDNVKLGNETFSDIYQTKKIYDELLKIIDTSPEKTRQRWASYKVNDK